MVTNSVYRRSTEGNRNSLNNRSSAGISNALNPVRGVRDAMRRKGIEPKNHHKANLEKMRQTAKQNRERKEMEEQQFQGKKKFKNVKSKFLTVASQAAEKAGVKHNFLKKKPSSNSPTPHKAEDVKRQSRLTKPPVPTQESLRRSSTNSAGSQRELGKKDYLSLNKQKARETKRVKEKEEIDFLAKKDYGKIPSYITKRKIEWAEKEEQKRLEADRMKIPPGMKLMSEKERVETLTLLKDNASKLEDALGKMSITSDTLKTRQRKAELREKLQEVDSAVKLFSKKHVFVYE